MKVLKFYREHTRKDFLKALKESLGDTLTGDSTNIIKRIERI